MFNKYYFFIVLGITLTELSLIFLKQEKLFDCDKKC